MHFQTLTAAAALLGGAALEVAASPVANNQMHAVLEARTNAHLTHREVAKTHAVHERQVPHVAKAWRPTKRVPAKALLPMRIGLKQRNLDAGHDRLMAIRDVNSEHYGKHMTAEEVIEFFAPAKASVDAVMDWLTESGISRDRISQSTNKQWIQFDATTDEAEELLLTEYFEYEHHSGIRDVGTAGYHLPKKVRSHVDYVTPGIRLRRDARTQEAAKLKKMKRSVGSNTAVPISIKGPAAQLPSLPALNSSACGTYVTPYCIKSQYSLPNGTTAVEGNELGIFESLNDHYSKADLDAMWKNVYTEVPEGTYPIDELIDGAIGAVAQADAGAESNLDFAASIPIIYPQKTILFQTDDQQVEINQTESVYYAGFWNTLFDAIDGSYCTYSAFGETGNCETAACRDPTYPDPAEGGYKGKLMCGVYKPTNVISISYGAGEADLPSYYWKRQCNEILKLGLQGTTTVISSGDYGVASFPDDGGSDGCFDETVFFPTAQASCPYALAVGATEFDSTGKNSSCKLREKATTSFASGGGFSNIYDAPDYQKEAVANYFKEVTLDFTGYTDPGTNFSSVGSGRYHIGGRGYPDVSAIGERFILSYEGDWYTIGGTSLAAPVWAAILTLVNEARITSGKGPVGYINPVLYQHPEVFTDITEGSNPGCGTTGFLAAKGWDPLTGLGSPKYPKLLNLLLNLP